jgi:multisubunit Na+/H+ antiporter MnhG subunit
MEPDPIQVEITNRGEGAATGIGLFLGVIGVVILVASIAFAATFLLLILVPILLIAPVAYLIITALRFEARLQDWLDAMGLNEDGSVR